MALSSKYKSFLASPTTDALAADASLHYIPTLTSINGSTGWLKHISQQEQLLKAKRNILNVVESGQDVVFETETTLNFQNGGGAFLPGMEDSFLVDRTVTLPVIHFVNFTPDQKIRQVRIFWDQGSLLKSCEVIGARGRNWPVFAGTDQIKIITKSAGEASASTAAASTATTDLSTEERQSRRQSRVGANGDKYTTLPFLKPHSEEERMEPSPDSVARRASAKPAPRDYHDLFAAGTAQPLIRPPSPTKENANPIKSGAGKHYNPSRLFEDGDEEPIKSPERGIKSGAGKHYNPSRLFEDGQEEPIKSPERGIKSGAGKHYNPSRLFEEGEQEPIKSPEKGIKTNPAKYNHFDFGEAETVAKPSHKKNRHGSQWDFADFSTPEKVTARPTHHTQRQNFSLEDFDQQSKPIAFRHPVPQARPDANPHFDFKDQFSPLPDKTERPAAGHHRMYPDADADNDVTSGPDGKMPLGNLTNTNVAARAKDFGPHFEISDQSPSSKENRGDAAEPRKPEAKSRAAKTMESSWELSDNPVQQQETKIKIAGNGMGSRKTNEKSWWEQ